MIRQRWKWRTLAAAGALYLPSFAASHAAAPPTEADVGEAIKRLEAEAYADRERASYFLWEAGKVAEPQLERALGHSNIEVRVRARRVLELLRFGLYADASPAHWEFIRKFHAGQPEEQANVLIDMLRKGETDLMMRLLEGSGSVSRPFLLSRLSSELEAVLPGLIIGKKDVESRRLVDLLASSGTRIRYAAWYHQLMGSADEAAAKLEALSSPDVTIRKRLYYLALVRNDPDRAQELAQELKLSAQERSVAFTDISPAEFAKQAAASTKDQVESLGFLAAQARLTGDQDGFQKNIAGLQRIARLSKKDRPFCLEALVINGELDAAVKSSVTAMDPFHIHARQWRVDLALQSLGITAQAPPFSPWIENLCQRIERTTRLKTREQLLAYPYALADLCIQTGEHEEAERVCRLAAASLLKADELAFQQAIRHEIALGLKSLAMEHAKQALQMRTPEISVFIAMYGKSNQHARNWFHFLRKAMPESGPDERLQILDRLLRPSEPDTEYRAATTALLSKAFEAENPVRGSKKKTWGLTLAYSASLHGLKAPDREEKDGDPNTEPNSTPPKPRRVNSSLPSPDTRSLRAAGETLLKSGRAKEAADTLGAALKASNGGIDPKLVFLHGLALEQAGDKAAGIDQQTRSRLIAPLTSDRFGFISFLWDHGKKGLVGEECAFLHLDDDANPSAASGRVFEVVAKYLAESEPHRAADLMELKLLTGIRKQEGDTLARQLEARFHIHLTRGIGLSRLGDHSLALAEFERAAKMLPADAQLAEALAPLTTIEITGGAATRLLNTIIAAAEAAAMQFPNSPLLNDNLARARAVRIE
jgi:tetratricopeptide (TPR) repeat protein